MNTDTTDKTPKDFHIKNENLKERLKKPFRKFLYPFLAKYRAEDLEKQYQLKEILGIDAIFADQRGNDYEAHRARSNKYKNIKDSVVLIIGIGTGRDLESWLKYEPKKIIAIDYFNYKRAWDMRTEQYKNKYSTEVEFIQTDILNMQMIKDRSVDIIGSDAVFEHINKFDDAITELYRVLKKDGVLYATFGPLYYSWGGDHISGKDRLIDGYNHIKLPKVEYEAYLDGFGNFEHSEEDGRTWITSNLFSYLKPKEYIEKIENVGFSKKYASVILEQRAIEFKKEFYKEFTLLEEEYGLENLIITGMTIIYAK